MLKQIEDMSFPPGWRALFKAAGVPNEALEDLASTRQIISLVNSTLESTALNSEVKQGEAAISRSQAQTPSTQSQGHLKNGSRERVRVAEKTTPSVEDPVEACDYSFSDDETLHLEDSLNISKPSDSLEEVSSADSLENSLKSSGGTQEHDSMALGTVKISNASHTPKVPLSVQARVSDIPSLPLDSLRSPSPQAVRVSMSSVYDSFEVDVPKAPPSTASGHDLEPSVRSNVPGRHLTPIVPRLSLGEITGENTKIIPPSKAPQDLPVTPLSSRTPLTPIGAQPKMTADVASVEQIRESEQHATKSTSPTMSARQARRLGLSNRSSVNKERPFASSPRESSFKITQEDRNHGIETKIEQDTEKDGMMAGSKNTARDQQVDLNVNNNSSPANGERGSAAKAKSSKQHMPVESKRTGFSDRNSKDPEDTSSGAGETQVSPKTSEDAKTNHSSLDKESHSLVSQSSDSLPLKASAPPPPPPPPPPPTFTPSGPQFSNTSTTSQELDRHTKRLAFVHEELLQVSQQQDLDKSTERRVVKKRRNFLKDRFHGNPHISVEASALVEQKNQLRSAALPHPNQLRDVPATGQVFTSMADLLHKVRWQCVLCVSVAYMQLFFCR